jgi:hypothetical protein
MSSPAVTQEEDSEFARYQQKVKEQRERERLLAEQQEQLRKEKEAEEASRRFQAEERARQQEQYVTEPFQHTGRFVVSKCTGSVVDVHP